jgi:hypothetical protein
LFTLTLSEFIRQFIYHFERTAAASDLTALQRLHHPKKGYRNHYSPLFPGYPQLLQVSGFVVTTSCLQLLQVSGFVVTSWRNKISVSVKYITFLQPGFGSALGCRCSRQRLSAKSV